MPKKIKLGIIGTGGMANYHAGQFKAIRGVELTACHDVVAERAKAFAEKHGFIQANTTADELIDAVDAVVVVTPDRFHAPVSLQVLKAGKHLLCEKPLTLTIADARKVARAALAGHTKTGLIHMINFSYRQSAAFQKAIELVRQGLIGEVRHVHAHYLQSWLTGDWTSEGLLWRLQTAKGSGGVLGDLGCHLLDFITAPAGELAALRCTMRTFPKFSPKGKKVTSWNGLPLDANDSVVLELHFANGALGLCHTTRWATGKGNSVALEVYGTEGGLRIDLDEDYNILNLCVGKDKDTLKWKAVKLNPTPGNYQRFIAAIKSGKPDQPDIVRGAQIQAYLDAAERSAKSGKPEKILAWL